MSEGLYIIPRELREAEDEEIAIAGIDLVECLA